MRKEAPICFLAEIITKFTMCVTKGEVASAAPLRKHAGMLFKPVALEQLTWFSLNGKLFFFFKWKTISPLRPILLSINFCTLNYMVRMEKHTKEKQVIITDGKKKWICPSFCFYCGNRNTHFTSISGSVPVPSALWQQSSAPQSGKHAWSWEE